MSNSKGISVLLLSIFVWFLNVQTGFGNHTYWSTKKDDTSSLRPAGKEGDHLLYACRTKIENDVIVGKIWPGPSCNGAYKGEKHYTPDFEVLHDSQDTTSWIPYTGSHGITNVIGGQVNRTIVFVCRAVALNWLVPGYLDTKTQTCNVEIGGLAVHVKEDFEVLVLNKLAMVQNSRICMSV